MSTHIGKLERSQINNLIMYLKFLGKNSQSKNKRHKEIIKLRAEINELEMKRMMQ
jgi:hypothetical protein